MALIYRDLLEQIRDLDGKQCIVPSFVNIADPSLLHYLDIRNIDEIMGQKF